MRPKIYLQGLGGKLVDVSNGHIIRLTDLDGVGEPSASVSTSKYAGSDGSYISSAFIESRNIVMDFKVMEGRMEHGRLTLYDIVQTRRPVRVLYQTKEVDVYTDGIVEKCEIDNFGKAITTGQISIICGDPFWYSRKENVTTIAGTVSGWHFPHLESTHKLVDPYDIGAYDDGTKSGVTPFSWYDENSEFKIHTPGIDTGITITMNFNGEVTNPTIYDEDTGGSLTVTGTYEPGDIVTVCTLPLNKYIHLNRNGTTTNITTRFGENSSWLVLKSGDNLFKKSADSGISYLQVTMQWRDAYIGV